jgi:hypothetical protein
LTLNAGLGPRQQSRHTRTEHCARRMRAALRRNLRYGEDVRGTQGHGHPRTCTSGDVRMSSCRHPDEPGPHRLLHASRSFEALVSSVRRPRAVRRRAVRRTTVRWMGFGVPVCGPWWSARKARRRLPQPHRHLNGARMICRPKRNLCLRQCTTLRKTLCTRQ